MMSRLNLVLGSLVALGPNEKTVRREREKWRNMLGFLYSTPAYWPSLELFGWQDRGGRNCSRSRARIAGTE